MFGFKSLLQEFAFDLPISICGASEFLRDSRFCCSFLFSSLFSSISFYMILFLPPIVSLLFLLVFHISFVAIFHILTGRELLLISLGRDLLICSRPVPFSVVVMLYKFLPAPNILT